MGILILLGISGLVVWTLTLPKPLNTTWKERSLTNLVPPPPNFKYRIIGSKHAKLSFEYHYAISYYDYNYETEFLEKLQDSVSIATGPDRENIQIIITAVSENGNRSKPFVIKTQERFKWLWLKYIGHTFVIPNS